MSGNRDELLFDALLEVAVTEAMMREMEALPSNEKLNEIYSPSPEMDSRIQKIIHQRCRKADLRRFAKGFGKAVACIAILLMVASAVLLSVEATRNAIFNAIIEWREGYTEVRFGDEEEAPQDGIYRPAYLPEGFNEVSCQTSADTTLIRYEKEDGDRIIFQQWPAESSSLLVDNENTNYIEIEVSGKTAYLFQALTEDDDSVLIWQSGDIVFQLISQVDSRELILIGESIKNN